MENESFEESLGEMMMNLISVEQTDSLRNATTFERYLGGSSANIDAYVLKLGGRSAVIVKTGISAFGQFPGSISDGEKVERIWPMPKAEVENVTGSSDAFWSALLAAHVDGKSWPEAVQFVNEVGVLKLRVVGHVEHMIDCESPYRRLDTLAGQHA
ncbi:MAG: carbohydrate kinase family protein [Actinomycetota bacterium]|jgi:sugar/nucleoside kinase (ribokinase family)|nr:carbohydrate kinase family protein [Actinomycetota bacterium]